MGFDQFKTIDIKDKEVFDHFFQEDPPLISEMTFTNLFIWHHRYRPLWLIRKDCLIIIYQEEGKPPYGLFPVGPGDKGDALDFLCEELKALTGDVHIRRVGEDSTTKHVDPNRYDCLPDPDNDDYVYLTQDLIHLPGRKYHRKKNHLNQFLKNYPFEYRSLGPELVKGFLETQEAWCQMRECMLNPDLLAEDYAVHEALSHFGHLDYQGGAIFINGKLEAFAMGERLNREMAVIHIEKANPDIPGLYAVINQRFCEHTWSHFIYVNREQDLGVEGLRKAKESYYPHHKVRKYTVAPKKG